MKGKTRITVNRETLREIFELHVERHILGRCKLDGFTMKRNGSVELVIEPYPAPTSEPRLTFDTDPQEDEAPN